VTAAHATLHFHGDLAALLTRGLVGPAVSCPVTRRASIKDVIEAMGPPHTEVGSIKVLGREVGFDHLPAPGEHIAVCPVSVPFDVRRATLLRPEPLPRLAFVVDANVARLGGLLRALGFDTAGSPDLDDAALADLASRQGRFALSRDQGLLKRRQVVFGRLVRGVAPHDQVVEVLKLLGLRPPFAAFTRCVRCNHPLEPVSKAAFWHRLLPLTRLYYDDFRRCTCCDRIYWPGSHLDRMRAWLDDLERALS